MSTLARLNVRLQRTGIYARTREGMTLDLLFDGQQLREPAPHAIAQALGQDSIVLHGALDRTQGRSVGRLRVWVSATLHKQDDLLARAGEVADRVEIPGLPR